MVGETLSQPFLPEPAMADPEMSSSAAPIAPVRLRRNAVLPAMNRGVYSSWDRDSTDDSRRSLDLPSHLGSVMTRSTKYDSVDLLRLLHETEGDGKLGMLSLPMHNSLMEVEERSVL